MITLQPLGYRFDSLEPVIDAKTMEIHWAKHHQAYIDNLNKVLEANKDLLIGEAKLETMSSLEMLANYQLLPEGIKNSVINNAGGDYNHCLWWEQLKLSEKENLPGGELKEKIDIKFGNFEVFWEEMVKVGLAKFGSGWVWLVLGEDGEIGIMSTSNQENPVMYGKKPLLGIDVWEHAYYLTYQNRRADYLKEVRRIINWEMIEKRWRLIKTDGYLLR